MLYCNANILTTFVCFQHFPVHLHPTDFSEKLHVYFESRLQIASRLIARRPIILAAFIVSVMFYSVHFLLLYF